MKEENLRLAIDLADRKSEVRLLIEKIRGHDYVVTALYSYDYTTRVSTERLLKFLYGEIQAINLELHNLGVDLPGVATIGEKQAVTKGMDQ